MSYTNFNLVKNHFRLDRVPGGKRNDFPVVFDDSSWHYLPDTGIVENSVVVKAVRGHTPEYEEVTLSGGETFLAHGRLLPESVVVASDSSLGTIFRENIDYCVDYTAGTVTRLADGEIPSGCRSSVWYSYYRLYTEGIDYSLDYKEGMIKKLAGGALQNGQNVLVDYETGGDTQSDETIAAAVSEANAIIEKEIDPGRRGGADPVLQTAATYLAVATICRIAVAGDLRSGRGDRLTAASWLSLAESYRRDCERLLENFHPPAAGFTYPTRA